MKLCDVHMFSVLMKLCDVHMFSVMMKLCVVHMFSVLMKLCVVRRCSVVRGTMADAQHFCLRWNNYQSSITSAFENLRDDEDFVDVTLACDGRSLKAHQATVSTCGKMLAGLLMFMHPVFRQSTPCKHPVIVLQDVSFADLHALVEFIYHGEVNVHQRNLSSFLKTAEVLRVSGLTQQAEDKEEVRPSKMHDKATGQSDLSSQGQSGRGNGQNTGYTAAKLEDSLFPSPPSPPLTTASGAIVNQRRPNMSSSASRRERRNSAAEHSDSSESPSKKVRPASQMVETINNNHSPEPVARPSSPQLSPSRSSSPTPGEGRVKPEPADLLGDNSSDSLEATDLGGSGRNHPSSLDQDDHDSIQQVSSYLTAAESKLFASSAGSFNFSMAALAADASNLSGLGGQGLNTNSDGTPGTSQELLATDPKVQGSIPGASIYFREAAGLVKLSLLKNVDMAIEPRGLYLVCRCSTTDHLVLREAESVMDVCNRQLQMSTH
uniref:BTB domain-containing protein n=1 Tax=Timema monikensis TaxID=170555 RepID=A0A7R9E6E7_9NEOP|nr:unnamed protein product [Timema monikensis]